MVFRLILIFAFPCLPEQGFQRVPVISRRRVPYGLQMANHLIHFRAKSVLIFQKQLCPKRRIDVRHARHVPIAAG